jgi:hypothetical protein
MLRLSVDHVVPSLPSCASANTHRAYST